MTGYSPIQFDITTVLPEQESAVSDTYIKYENTINSHVSKSTQNVESVSSAAYKTTTLKQLAGEISSLTPEFSSASSSTVSENKFYN